MGHAPVPPIVNPFFFESPTDKWSFTDREELIPRLRDLLAQRGRRMLVKGRRRMGKTSLLQHVARVDGRPFLYVDVSAAASLPELARALLDQAPRGGRSMLARLLPLAERFLKKFTVSLGKIELGAELREEDGHEQMRRVLEFLNARAADEDRPWTICLDEFQEIRVLGGDRVHWPLRAFTQEHRAVNYVFCGSDHRLPQWISSQRSPFFKQLEQLEVGPMDPAHFAKWIEERAARGGLPRSGLGEQIVAAAGPCTGDVVRLAKMCFDFARQEGGVKNDVVERAMKLLAMVELRGEHLALWMPLFITQRAVLRAIAAGMRPSAAETLREFGIKSASTATTAIDALIDRYILVRNENGELAFDSPFFKFWVAAGAA